MHDKEFSFRQGVSELLKRTIIAKKPVLVPVAGGSCSGKGYLSSVGKRELSRRGLKSSTVPLDNFFKDIEDPSLPKDDVGNCLFDVPGSYHQHEILMTLSWILSGRDIRLPCYNKESNTRLARMFDSCQAAPIVIVEGLFAITFAEDWWPSTIKVFIEADPILCLQRRIKRDKEALHESEELIRRMFWQQVYPNYQEFVLPQRAKADIIIKNEDIKK